MYTSHGLLVTYGMKSDPACTVAYSRTHILMLCMCCQVEISCIHAYTSTLLLYEPTPHYAICMTCCIDIHIIRARLDCHKHVRSITTYITHQHVLRWLCVRAWRTLCTCMCVASAWLVCMSEITHLYVRCGHAHRCIVPMHMCTHSAGLSCMQAQPGLEAHWAHAHGSMLASKLASATCVCVCVLM